MRPYVHFKTYQKVISMFLVICFLVIPLSFLTLPKKAEATCVPIPKPLIPDPTSVPVHMAATNATNQKNEVLTNTQFFKNCVLDGYATMVAKMIIKALTGSLVRWINSGFKGNPSFVGNTGAFMSGVADKVAGRTIEQIAPALCSPFRAQITLALAQGATGSDDISCTLSNVETNFKNFVGGSGSSWDNWFNITQNPQNNPYGAMMLAQSKISASVQTAQGKYQQQLDWGKGFFSFEDCPSNTLAQSATTKEGLSMTVTSDGHSNKPVMALPKKSSMANPSDNSVQGNASSNSLASIGSLGLLDSIFGNAPASDSLAATGFWDSPDPATRRPVPAGAASGNYYNDAGYVSYRTAGGGSVSSSGVLAGTSMGSSQTAALHANPDNPNDKQVYDANDNAVYGMQAGDNGCTTKTPGAVIEQQLEGVLGSDLRGLEIAQSIDQIVQALVGQLISQVMGGFGGLTSAGSSGSSGSNSNSNYQNAASAAGITIPDLPILGSCMPSSQNAQIGDTVTWTAIVPDINGSVSYEWYGDENLSGNGSTATTSYASDGLKEASVIVTTTGTNPQSVQIDCTPGIGIGNVSASASTPTIACTVSPSAVSINTPVTWQAVVLGGVPPFIYYSWQGDDGLTGTGQTAVKSYTTAGAKTATVSVTSADGNTYSHACSSAVSVTP